MATPYIQYSYIHSNFQSSMLGDMGKTLVDFAGYQSWNFPGTIIVLENDSFSCSYLYLVEFCADATDIRIINSNKVIDPMVAPENLQEEFFFYP